MVGISINFIVNEALKKAKLKKINIIFLSAQAESRQESNCFFSLASWCHMFMKKSSSPPTLNPLTQPEKSFYFSILCLISLCTENGSSWAGGKIVCFLQNKCLSCNTFALSLHEANLLGSLSLSKTISFLVWHSKLPVSS